MDEPARFDVLVSAAGEMEAAVILGVLEENGIPARSTGGYTSDFQIGLPSGVCVLVAEKDLARARGLLDEVRREHRESPPPRRRRFQYSLAALLVFQAVFAVVLSIWRAFATDAPGAMLFFGAVFSPMLVAIIAGGTVWIASDLTRARKAWRRVGLLLAVVFASIALVVLIRAVLARLGVAFW
jgi:hypothetical protein